MLKTNCLVVVVDGKDMYLETVDVAAATLLNKVRQAATPVIMGNPELLQQLCVHLVLGRSFRALDGSRCVLMLGFLVSAAPVFAGIMLWRDYRLRPEGCFRKRLAHMFSL